MDCDLDIKARESEILAAFWENRRLQTATQWPEAGPFGTELAAYLILHGRFQKVTTTHK